MPTQASQHLCMRTLIKPFAARQKDGRTPKGCGQGTWRGVRNLRARAQSLTVKAVLGDSDSEGLR